MTRARRFLVGTLVVLAAVVAVFVVRPGNRPTRLDLVVAPHPDDEMQAWSLVQDDTEAHTVFAFLTRGEETTMCRTGLPGLDAAHGEAAPVPRPRGRWTDSCARARMNSTLAFLGRMGDGDDSLPASYGDATVAMSSDVHGRRCDDGSCRPAGDVRVHAGGEGATVLFFDLGDGDLTVDEVGGAITTIVEHRTDLGLPDLPWTRLVAASYANAGEPDCFEYTHPDHVVVSEAVDDDGHGFVERFVPTCATSGSGAVNRVVDADAWDTAFAVDPDGTRSGPHPTLYGWLLDPYWKDDPDLGSQDELFHRDQYFVRRARGDT